MVEQEHSKSSTVFPDSLTSNNNSQKHSTNPWFLNDATSIVKSEELCSSDMLNIELLYGNVLPTTESFSAVLLDGNVTERNNIFFHETLPNDIFSMNDSTPCDLYYNDKNASYDCWNPMTEKVSSVSDSYFEANSPLSFWGSCPLDSETLKMDDVFQVDKDDLVQSPTLAELNANDESLFDSFDNFDIPLPSEHKCAKSSSFTPGLNSSSVYKMSSLNETSQLKPNSEASSDRTNLLLNMDPSSEKDGISESEARSGFNPKESKMDSLAIESVSSPEKPSVTMQVMTKAVKKPYPVDELSIENSEGKRTENVSEFSLSSNRETLEESEEDDSEMDCDYSSDVDEESDEETKKHSSKRVASNNLLLQKKKSRYFWQYNIQSKGPKAPKVKLDEKSTVMDKFPGISDPVFTSNYMKGIKHAGKARRGDGNDLTPNPQKLYNIGLELEKLTSVIEGLIPANELPLNARSKSRKEKNKLASRACRLKKKAQHEANKLKLFGLQKEQKHLMSVIKEVKKIIKKSVDNMKQGKVQSKVHAKIESLCMKKCHTEVAGCSAEFVNSVLKNIDSGDKTGGLDIETQDE